MPKFSRLSVAYVAVVLGVILLGLVALFTRQQMGNWQYLLYLAAALIWYGSVNGMARWSGTRWNLRSGGADEDLAESVDPVELLAQKESALEELAQQLDRREQVLASQIVTYHEWMEFPQPIDLTDAQPSDERLVELVELDRQTIELLERASKEIFDSILENRYAVDGKFQPTLLVQEAWQLANQVARIYQPSSKNPLLETSAEQIFYAVSRACLQFLVVIDELPLNVKQLNINSLYGYVRRAVQAYGVYRKARPFLQIAGKGYQLGRYALGANPVSMGAWWMLQSVGSRGAKALASRVVNRQALGLLNNLVRVIGFEVAGIYGGDFRYRDPNWIYGTELTELLSIFPARGEMLAQALSEVGALQLRSEYDRIFLYRCLAAGKTGLPKRYRAEVVLTEKERQSILSRLERFASRFLLPQDLPQQQPWRSDVEERLAVRFSRTLESTPALPADQRHEALQSLAGYVFAIKEYAAADIAQALQGLPLFDDLSPAEQQVLSDQWEKDPPSQFEPAGLPQDSTVVDEYLNGLIQLAARLAPRIAVDQAVVEIAGYLGREEKTITRQLAIAYHEQLQRSCVESKISQRVPTGIACAILDLLETDETVSRLYRNVQVESAQVSEMSSAVEKSCWLVATSQRAVMLAAQDGTKMVWQSADQPVQVEKQAGLVRSACRLQGGHWLLADLGSADLLIKGDPLMSYEQYFAPLVRLFGT